MDYLYIKVVFAFIREGIRIIASRSPVIDTKGLRKILDNGFSNKIKSWKDIYKGIPSKDQSFGHDHSQHR